MHGAGVNWEQLTDEQRFVVESTSSTTLVLGGAGVGKTTTALWAARRELLGGQGSETSRPSSRVLFVTFSRTAVGQIRSRAAGVLRGISEEVEIVTFHGLAFRLLSSFGRYIGLGDSISIQSEARERLGLSSSIGSLRYDELIPLALRIFETPGPFGELLKSRWSLAICDEFQDTDEHEWRLLESLGERARLLLLADPNQMIYGFKKGVSVARLDRARSRENFSELTLPPGSHRDPSQIIPDAASEVRWRRFESESVKRAVSAGRLVVLSDVPDTDRDRSMCIAQQVSQILEAGHESIGIYAKTNSDTAKLSMGLTLQGVDHVPIGFGESYGESLESMTAMLEYSHERLPWEAVMVSLGVAITASIRSPKPSPLATAFKNCGGLPLELDRRLDRLKKDLVAAREDVGNLSEVISNSWEQLGISSGRRAWRRAGRSFGSILEANKSRLGYSSVSVAETVSKLRSESFVDLDTGDQGRIQLMNFHQTKGREADAVVLSYSSSDWYGSEGEPYEEASRILYVSMTRARHLVVILLPPSPHPLVAPFQSLVSN